MRESLFVFASAILAVFMAGCAANTVVPEQNATSATTASATATPETTQAPTATPAPTSTPEPTAEPEATPAPVAIKLKGASTVTAGKGIQLCPVTEAGEDVDTTILAWTSSDTSVAIVTNGWIDAKSAGTVTITAEGEGYIAASQSVTVQPKPTPAPVTNTTTAPTSSGSTSVSQDNSVPANPAPVTPEEPTYSDPAPEQPAYSKPSNDLPPVGENTPTHSSSDWVVVDPSHGNDVTLD